MARKTGSRSEITGPRVDEVTQRLFAERGYAAVSMREIAKEVGVQAGALYNYTPDKQALLFRIMQRHLQDLTAAWAAENKPDEPVERLEHFTRFHIGFHVERPESVFIAYMELRNLSPENLMIIEALRKTYEQVLEDILKTGQKAGQFRVPDIRLATKAVIAMLTGVNTWYGEGRRLSRAKVEEIYRDMVLRSVQV